MSPLSDIVPPGVVTGDNLLKLLTHARENGYAIPAFNCTRYVRSIVACSDRPFVATGNRAVRSNKTHVLAQGRVLQRDVRSCQVLWKHRTVKDSSNSFFLSCLSPVTHANANSAAVLRSDQVSKCFFFFFFLTPS